MTLPTRQSLDAARARAESIRRQMIATQEELDWRCYQAYGLTQTELTHANPPEIAFGERAFEIVLARRMAAGDEETTWFARHGATPITQKYKSADFQKSDTWRLRGGLDVAKERFVAFPHCGRDADGSLVIAWAGWNPLQLGTAIATYYLDMKDNEGWDAERLKPLLAGIAELLPWIRQWHNAPDSGHDTRMGDYLDGFIDEEARSLGLTRAAVVGWRPPATTARQGRKRAK